MTGRRRRGGLGARQRAILAFVMEHPRSRIREIALGTGLPIKATANSTWSLYQRGLLGAQPLITSDFGRYLTYTVDPAAYELL